MWPLSRHAKTNTNPYPAERKKRSRKKTSSEQEELSHWISALPQLRQSPQRHEPNYINPREYNRDEEGVRQLAYGFAVIALAAKLARADGTVNHKEVQGFYDIFQAPGNPNVDVEKFFYEACNDPADHIHYARQIRRYFPANATLLERLMASLVEFALTDGPLKVEELRYLHEVVDVFGLGEGFIYDLLENHLVPSSYNFFAMLDLSPKTPRESVRKAYKEAIKQYHPDQLSDFKDYPAFLTIANERLRVIQAAYHAFKADQ